MVAHFAVNEGGIGSNPITCANDDNIRNCSLMGKRTAEDRMNPVRFRTIPSKIIRAYGVNGNISGLQPEDAGSTPARSMRYWCQWPAYLPSKEKVPVRLGGAA